MANKYIPDDAAERLEALAKEAGVPLATLISKLTWFFGEPARDLAIEHRKEEEALAARQKAQTEGRAA